MEIKLHYGSGRITLQIPPDNIAGSISPLIPNHTRPEISLVQLTEQPAARTFQGDIRSKRLCVLLPDGTRDFPWNTAFRFAFDLLKNAKWIDFIVCTGTHSSFTSENEAIVQRIREHAARTGLFNWNTIIHDCEKAEFLNAGRTDHGTEILYNAQIDKADLYLVLSDVKFHYFAGYSNPVKNFVPGICAYQTAERNHSLSFDNRSCFGNHPWHPDPTRQTQPLAQDMLTAMEKIVKDRPVWALVTISSKSKLHWANFGPVRKVTAEAFRYIDRETLHTAPPREPNHCLPRRTPGRWRSLHCTAGTGTDQNRNHGQRRDPVFIRL